MNTIMVALTNDTPDSGWLTAMEWSQIPDALAHIRHSYNVQNPITIKNSNYLFGFVGEVDSSDYEALTLSVAAVADAYGLNPAYVGIIERVRTNIT